MKNAWLGAGGEFAAALKLLEGYPTEKQIGKALHECWYAIGTITGLEMDDYTEAKLARLKAWSEIPIERRSAQLDELRGLISFLQDYCLQMGSRP